MIQKLSIPKGTRDFSPVEMVNRNYIFNTIKDVFSMYGFQPIETPAMENLSTLMGKYGEEGDRLLFRILNSGDFMSKVGEEELCECNSAKLAGKISEKGLRYDLTVPFARYVAQHRNDIVFPFRRYQIQPVWRADRPQKGRYREFYQCDVDIIGSNSLLNEVELIQVAGEVFRRLKLDVAIKLNNRKILTGIVETIGEESRITDIIVAIDKLPKIGIEKVKEELAAKSISKAGIEKLQPILNIGGTNEERLRDIEKAISGSKIGAQGVSEVRGILEYVDNLPVGSSLEVDFTLARGLNYYTGAIFEVVSKDVEIGSITGGGRYDNLTGIFGLPDVSGVGISFGADRIYDVMSQLDIFTKESVVASRVMFVNFGAEEEKYCLSVLSKLRAAGISGELYPEAAKMKKQMSYANRKGVLFVALAGSSEMEEDTVTLKNMKTGEQLKVTPDEIVHAIMKHA